MLYYRVKPEHDNRPVMKYGRRGGLEFDTIFVGGELYTPKEVEKLYKTHLVKLTREQLFQPVNVSKKSVYWFFGARFSDQLKGR